eukprot:scaffold319894_cov18-Tisochrysis_lutea.AAC.1
MVVARDLLALAGLLAFVGAEREVCTSGIQPAQHALVPVAQCLKLIGGQATVTATQREGEG